MTEKAKDIPNPEITSELEALRAEIERLTAALAEETTKNAESPLHAAEEMAEELSEKAQEGWNELQKQISDNPVQSAAIAFGIGFILSRLLSR